MRRITVLMGVLAIVLTSFAIATAQEPSAPANTTPNVQQTPRGRMAQRRMMRRRARGALRSLNLTDAQKEQAQALRRENFERNRAVREELKQLLQKRQEGTLSEADQARARELRRQLRQSHQNMRTQLAGLLTEEQKTKLQDMRKNRRENRGWFGRRGQGLNKPI